MAESNEKMWPFKFHQVRSRQIHKAIREMIAVDKEPISIVKDDGFNHLLKLLEPCYKPPSSKWFSEMFIPEMHQNVSEKVRVYLLNIDNLFITADILSSVVQDSYISLTFHSIMKEFQYQHICLHAAPFNE